MEDGMKDLRARWVFTVGIATSTSSLPSESNCSSCDGFMSESIAGSVSSNALETDFRRFISLYFRFCRFFSFTIFPRYKHIPLTSLILQKLHTTCNADNLVTLPVCHIKQLQKVSFQLSLLLTAPVFVIAYVS